MDENVYSQSKIDICTYFFENKFFQKIAADVLNAPRFSQTLFVFLIVTSEANYEPGLIYCLTQSQDKSRYAKG